MDSVSLIPIGRTKTATNEHSTNVSCSGVNPVLNNLDNSDLKFKSLNSFILIAWQKTLDQKKRNTNHGTSVIPGLLGLSYMGRSCL